MEIKTVSLSELVQWDKNPRGITKKDFENLKKRLTEKGQFKPLVVNQDNIVLGGNMRLMAMRELGMDGVEIVRVETKNEQEMIWYALADNEQLGRYIGQELAELTIDLPGLDDIKVDLGKSIELADLKDRFRPVEEDEVLEVPVGEPESVYGEIYELGRHRLGCLDATKKEDVEKLMDGKRADMFLTDPPYGVSYGDKNAFLNAIGRPNRIQENMDNDTKSVLEMKELWVASFKNALGVTKEGGCYYICSPQGGELMMMMMMSILEAGWELKHCLIWVKNNIVLGRSDYNYQHEPLLYGWKGGAGHNFYGESGARSVWQIDKPLSSKLHPTMKPIELCAKAIKNSSKPGNIVLDLFGGSGSTMIAAEQLGRTCFTMEISEKYCDVIRRRYANYKEKTT